MKKLVILLFICNIAFSQTQSVFSKYAEQFNKAVSTYNEKLYQQALYSFESLSKVNPENPEVHFYTGLCLLELKHYDQALGAFDRVLMLEPTHTRTHLEIARVYFETKAYALASSKLDLVLKSNIPQNVKETVLQFKANINDKLTKHYFSGAISVGLSYDSNANNDVGNIQFVVPSFNVTVLGSDEKSDSSLSLSTYLIHRYDIGENGNWVIDSKGLLYGKFNKEFTSNNISLWSLTTAPTYFQDRIKVAFPLSLDSVYLSGKNYVQVWQFGVEGTYLIDKKSNISTALRLKRNKYDEDKDLDIKSKVLELKYKRAFGNDPISMTLGITYEKNSKIRGTRTDVDGDSLSYNIELSKEVYKDLLASLGYTHISKKFDDLDLSFLNKREDKQDKYNLGLTYKLTKDSYIQATMSYMNQHSNQAPFEYDKKMIGMNFIKRF